MATSTTPTTSAPTGPATAFLPWPQALAAAWAAEAAQPRFRAARRSANAHWEEVAAAAQAE